ncbi:SOS response-associated peptidase family protein [Rahnella victoriana]|uniref:Abasic site processing protein n=1 Tax=Rahnella victoriana TaxID=1510570 RepID=A0ABS0DTZ8_9GAMM|nr:SOS response-associated peptidase family protein [Rahnella victoriana]MBF7957365.1 SOS response-associated peptidase family protein [Rahnella victoriana]
MCGRFTQYEPRSHYIDVLAPDKTFASGIDDIPLGRYNVTPGTRVLLLNQRDDKIYLDPVKWGYQPGWAKESKRPPMINARVETVATSRMFKPLFEQGRALVMADGWYEWKKDANDSKVKQPYFIYHASHTPLFFAAISRFHPDAPETPEEDGFVIVTAASDEGLVDIHDRRPLVLDRAQALEWLDGNTLPERALEIAEKESLPPAQFTWQPVTKKVGNIRNNGADLIEQISDPLL